MSRRSENVRQRRPWQDEEYAEDRYTCDVDGLEEAYAPDQVDEIIATNRMVLLTCTLAAMLPPFALFLIFAEKKSRAIRWFSLQSVLLTAVHLVIAGVLMAVNAVFAAIPYFGFLINLVLWIVYIIALILMAILRIRMMLCAWQGVKFTLPVFGSRMERFC